MRDHLGPTLTPLADAWAAFSWLAAIAGLSGLGLVLAAAFGLGLVPERLRPPAILTGAALIARAAVWQAAEAKGAHDAYAPR